eukprot:191248_1
MKSKPKPKPKVKAKTKPKRILYSHDSRISCDECDACPIRGARYTCMVRPNYNICEECEIKLIDKISYPMIKIYEPRTNWHIKHFEGLRNLVAIPEFDGNKQSTPSDISDTENENKITAGGNIANIGNINDPNSMLSGFPFMSKEMQEKYIDAMKQFNEKSEDNNERKDKSEEIQNQQQPQQPQQRQQRQNKNISNLESIDSVSQSHSHKGGQRQLHQPKEEQSGLSQIIQQQMPSIQQPQETAQSKTQSLMQEIDELLKPSTSTTKNNNINQQITKRSNNINNINNKNDD